LHAIVKELRGKLADARINNIYQLDAKTLLLKLHKVNEAPLMLVIEAGRRIHLTSYTLEKPKSPPAFCMTLRKYLPGAWISAIEQYEFERIAIFHIQTKTGMMHLILELFGEGNIILTGGKSDILQALFFKRMRDRNIVRNEIYQYPPSGGKNPFKVTRDELDAALKAAGETDVVRCIVRFLGVGGVYGEELLQRANVEKNKHANQLTSSEVDAIYASLQSLLAAITPEKLEPCITLDDAGGFVDVVPVKLKRYENCKLQPYASFSEALDEFYVRVTAAEKAVAGINIGQFKRESERLKRMIADQEHALQEDDRKTQRDKHLGDTIYAHFSDLQVLLDKFSSAHREGRNISAVAAEVLEAKKNRQNTRSTL